MKRRLFIAIDPPEYALKSIARLKIDVPGIRWTDLAYIHLTLKFIGDVELPGQTEIIEKLREIEVESFILPVSGMGIFPQRGIARILWVGHEKAHPRLFQLHKKIQDSLLTIGIGVEERSFHPHMTIARLNKVKPGAIQQFLKQNKTFETAPFKVTAFSLYSSILRPSGPVYQEESCFTLRS